MEIWAKLFESTGYQVLVCKAESDDEKPAVKFEMLFSGGMAALILGFKTKAFRDKAFKNIGQEEVDNSVREMLQGVEPFESRKEEA